MNLFRNERVLFIAIILGLVAVLGVIGFKTNEANKLMLIPRDRVEDVNTCLDNEVSCSMIYDSVEDIPLE